MESACQIVVLTICLSYVSRTYLEVERLNFRFMFALFHWSIISGCFNFKKCINLSVSFMSLFHMLLVIFPVFSVSVPGNVLFPVFDSCWLAAWQDNFAFSNQEVASGQFSGSGRFEFMA